MLKASGTVLSSFKSTDYAEHFKKTKGKPCRILSVDKCSEKFTKGFKNHVDVVLGDMVEQAWGRWVDGWT